MKLILTLLLFFVLSCGTAFSKDKAPEVQEISIVGEGIGNGGRPVLVVTCAAKKADKVTFDELCRCAVRCVLFKGWADKSKSASYDSSVSHPALAGNPDVEAQHIDYFNDFFSSGEASKYVDIVEDTRKVTKSGKQYQVSQMVTVNVPALRSKLERDNIIKSLKSGW